MKPCSKCGKVQPFENYHKDGHRGHLGVLRAACKTCTNAENSARNKTTEAGRRRRELHAMLPEDRHEYHKKRNRSYHRRTKYGLTDEAFDAMQAMQDGLCGICGDRDGTHIDHRHEDGLVRMLLCNQCNQLLGFARENPQLLHAAADYVTSWER